MTVRKVRREENRHAQFIASRHQYQQKMDGHSYRMMLGSVQMRLVNYDPAFDFESPPHKLNCSAGIAGCD